MARVGTIARPRSHHRLAVGFAGLSILEAAEVLGVSPSTVDREWAFRRRWFGQQLWLRGE